MAKSPLESPMNPLLLWTDLGLRAADIAMGAMQNLGDGVDRFARAGAGTLQQPWWLPPVAEAEADAADATSDGGEHDDGGAAPAWPLTPNAAEVLAGWQAMQLQLMARGWQQWQAALRLWWPAGGTDTLTAPGGETAAPSVASAWTSPADAATAWITAISEASRGGSRREGEAPTVASPEHAAAASGRRSPRRTGRGGRSGRSKPAGDR